MDPYDQVPYGGRPLPEAHPDRLFVVARMFGVPAAPPATARVLEVGCGAGAHLIPIAVRSPDSTCVGLERAASAVEAARQASDAVTWIEADLVDADSVLAAEGLPEAYDYILAHGVYSWVPPEVRRALLRLVGRWLAPNGVAYVSYNTRPGWHVRGMLSEMLRFHAAPFERPGDRIGQARAFLDFLAEVVPETDPYGGWLRREARLVRSQPDAWVFHDLLAETNEPVLLTDFVAAAREQDLAYLGDADLPSMLSDRLPVEVRRVLDRIGGDQVNLEQYIDFVLCRNFRRTLLVRSGVEIDRHLRWEKVCDLAVRSLLVPDGPVAPDGTEPFRTLGGDGGLQTAVPALRAALHVLFDRSPDPVPLAELQGDREQLCKNLLVCFTRGLVTLHPGSVGAASTLAARPVADPLVRAQAARGDDQVTSLLHEPVRVDDLDRKLLPLLDGTRGLHDLRRLDRDAVPHRLGAYARAALLRR